MQIQWADGHTSVYSFTELRLACPCAHCDADRDSVEAAADINVLNVAEVGHYALRFTWSDGHDTGIYAYDYLRGMCSCKTCSP